MGKRFYKHIFVVCIMAVLAVFMSACGNTVSVSALDYDLENVIYNEQVNKQQTIEAPGAPVSTEESAPIQDTVPTGESAPIQDTIPTEESDPSQDAAPTEEAALTEGTLYSYAVIVQMENGKRLTGARVSLYSGDRLLYSAMTDSNGSVSWRLPEAQAYKASAELNGYEIVSNDSAVDALDKAATVMITMRAAGENKAAQETPNIQELPAVSTFDSFQMYLDSLDQVKAELIPIMTDIEEAYKNRFDSVSETYGGVSFLRATEGTSPEGFASASQYEKAETLTIDNWNEILAVYIAAKTDGYAEMPLGLYSVVYNGWNGLTEVVDDMLQLSLLNMPDGVYVSSEAKTWQDMAQYYKLSPERTAFLEKLLEPEYQQTIAALYGKEKTTSYDVSVEEIINGLPQELPAERRSVVESACSLVGEVDYFWGGKYNDIGRCDSWGTPTTVTAEGSDSTGQLRNYGLDCSGFVTWSFINGFNDKEVTSLIGEGSSRQWDASSALDWSEGQPGDLVFLNTPNSGYGNHIGIILRSVGDGNYIVVNCAEGGGVTISDAWGMGFNYVRRPNIYS